MKPTSTKSRPRLRSMRHTARALALITPLLLLPIVLASSAVAKTSTSAACVNGSLGGVGSLAPTGQTSSATVELLDGACTTQQVSLISYQTEGPDYNSAGAETRFDLTTKDVTAVPQTLTVLIPNCFFQVDLIYGADVPVTLQHQELYFTHHGTLIASFNGGTENCAVAPTESAPSGPTLVQPPPSVAIDLQSVSRPPVVDRPQAPPNPPAAGNDIAVIQTPTPLDDLVISPSPKASVLAQTFTQAPKAGGLPFTGFQIVAMLLLSAGLLAGGISVTAFVRRRGGQHS
jgi:hypothetical protein